MKKLLLLFILFLSINTYAQKEANFWYFGENAGLDFTTETPVALTDGMLSTAEGSATISDANGNLLFYTDGTTVFNKDHNTMSNGTGLEGNSSSSQSAIIVPKPLDTNIYFIFTVGRSGGPNSVKFSIVDMSLDGGLGGITSKNNQLNDIAGNPLTAREKITSVKGNGCNEFWVITSDTDKFYAYKVDSNGVNLAPLESNFLANTNDVRGYLKLSPDGTKLVNASSSSGSFIYDFNATSGSISNGRRLDINGRRGYGVEFSRSGNKLYISTGTHSQLIGGGSINPPNVASIFQFSLASPIIADINNSRERIYTTNSGYRGALQLAPNGKIYYARSHQPSLGVINFPENNFNSVSFEENGVSLNGKNSREGLPPFIQSFFLPIIITDNDTGQTLNNQNLQFCVGDNKIIQPDLTNPAIVGAVNPPTYEWVFDNGGGGAPVIITHTVNLTLNALTAADNGDYKLKVTLTDICGNNTTLEGVFNITVYEAPNATQPTNINFCDTDNDGFNSFNLQADKNATILNGLDPATFDVMYYLTQADADADINALANPYTNTTAFTSQTMYARVHNKNAPTACYATTNFTLAVTGLPVPQEPTDYNICDDISVGTDTDGFINHFRLNTRDAQILGGLNPAIYNVSYHTTLVGSQTDNSTNVIDKTIDYTNTTANLQTVFVRVENINNTGCNDTSKTLNLVVNPLPVFANTPTVELKQCDDDVDGFSDFNLFEAASLISDNYTNETFAFYLTLAEAQDDNAIPIANPIVFNNATANKVWARVISSFDCYRIAEVTLTVSVTQIPVGFSRSFDVCDDYIDAINDDQDGISTFNFSSVTSDVLATLGNPNNVIVTYYKNEAGALAEDPLERITDTSNYRNIGYPNSQPIYIRVDSSVDNSCVGFGPYITLTVNNAPTAAIAPNLELCDDFNDGNGTNGIVQTFNLSSQNATILGAQNPANFTVSYHLSAADANTGANIIPTPAAYTNITRDLQTIYVRVTNNNGGCFTAHSSFELIVHPLPIANFVDNIEICDDPTDGSARNGFSQSIDLSQQTATILGSQDPNQFSVSYHISLANAQSNLFPLVTTNYSNVTPDRETIYVRVFNSNTGCANGISNFDVIINPEPLANPDNTVSNLSVCDDDNGGLGDDTDGIVENIDLDSQIPTILGAAQDPDDYIVTFYSNQADATAGVAGTELQSPYTNTNSTETIYVRIQHKATGCVNDDFTFDVIINSLPDFQITSPQIVCLNPLPKSLGVENPNDVYDYLWKDENGVVISTNSTANISSGGLYSVTATSTTGTNCTRTRSIQVNESIVARLTEADITIVDDSENNSISINNVNDNLGIGDYEYALTDENGNFIRIYQDETLFENLEGNIYNILIRDKNGCGVKELLIPVVQFPKFFTPNNDGINDVFKMKGVNKTFFPISEMYIFNRFGKVVAKIAIDGPGWDGTYNGKVLISDDYWFSIKLVDRNGVKRELKGNFSLLRK